MNRRNEQLAEALIEYLDERPGRSIWEIEKHLRKTFNLHRVHGANIIYLIRNVYGSEVVVCHYNWYRHAYVYSLAESADEGQTYVARRVVMVRSVMFKLVRIIDRIVAKFPDDAATPAIVESRTRLLAAASVLDEKRAAEMESM